MDAERLRDGIFALRTRRFGSVAECMVKRKEFDVLYYGLFFSDFIKIFRIASKDIKENRRGGLIYYSDFQHKGNVGEGQFHVNPRTLQIHLGTTTSTSRSPTRSYFNSSLARPSGTASLVGWEGLNPR